MKNYLKSNFQTTRPRTGFTLVELMIVVAILGILAAIVIPEFQGHIQQAKEAAAKDNLRLLREAIERYAQDHNGVPPGYPYADTSLTPNSMFFMKQIREGNYLSDIPTNPIKDEFSVYIVPDGTPFPSSPVTVSSFLGWVYKPETKEIRLNSEGLDSSGTVYFD